MENVQQVLLSHTGLDEPSATTIQPLGLFILLVLDSSSRGKFRRFTSSSPVFSATDAIFVGVGWSQGTELGAVSVGVSFLILFHFRIFSRCFSAGFRGQCQRSADITLVGCSVGADGHAPPKRRQGLLFLPACLTICGIFLVRFSFLSRSLSLSLFHFYNEVFFLFGPRRAPCRSIGARSSFSFIEFMVTLMSA